MSQAEKNRIDAIIHQADIQSGGAPSMSGGQPVDTTYKPPTGTSSGGTKSSTKNQEAAHQVVAVVRILQQNQKQLRLNQKQLHLP